MQMKTFHAIAGAALLTLLLPNTPASSAANDAANCRSAPDPECLLALAHETTDRIAEPTERARILTLIAGAEAAAGYAEQSRASIADAMLIADASGPDDSTGTSSNRNAENPDRRMDLYLEIMSAQAQTGWSADAIIETGRRADTAGGFPPIMLYFMTARSLTEAGRPDDVRPLVDDMLKQISSMDDPAAMENLYSAVVSILTEIGDFDGALAVLEQSKTANPMANFGVLIRMFYAQQSADDQEGAAATLAKAEEWAGKIEDPSQREMVETMLADMRPASGEETDETETAERNGGGCSADLSDYGFAIGRAQLGYFDTAVELALALDDPEKRDRALGRIADIQAEAGDPDGAYGTAMLVTDEFTRSYALATIAQAQAARGNVDGALATAQAIPESYYGRDELFTGLVSSLAESGNYADAATLTQSLPKIPMQAEAYAGLAQKMAEGIGTENNGEAPAAVE